jgi:CO/xanthine dehydrogenase Mo-binding subunit
LREGAPGDVAAAFTVCVGNADAAFASAAIVTRGRYSVQRYTGMPLEPRGVVADYDAESGRLTVWSSTQWSHALDNVPLDVLGLPEPRVRAIAPDVGATSAPTVNTPRNADARAYAQFAEQSFSAHRRVADCFRSRTSGSVLTTSDLAARLNLEISALP